MRAFLAGAAAAGVWLAVGGATEAGEARTEMISPKVVSIHTVDASSPEAIVKAIIKPGMTQEEKALAVWRYCWQNLYHWPAPQEEGRSKHELDVVYDVNKLFNVYGYTYCFAARAPAEALCQAAGLEARSGGIGGHLIWEACFNGRYHYIDSDQRGFSRLDDGTIAALEDYRGRARELVLAPKGPSTPFFPAVKRPMMIYEQKQIFTGYMLNHAVHYYQHDKFRTTHPMNLCLRPGERFTRSWANVGKWSCPPGLAAECKGVGYVDPWPGPRDHEADLYPESPRNDDGSPLSYANGLLVYRPNLAAGAGDYAAGVFRDENVAASGGGFGPAAKGKPARADFRVWLPYVIAGWPGDVEKLNVTGAAVVSGRCLRKTAADAVKVLVSNDEGGSWQEAWSAAQTGESDFAVDISKLVEGRYGYQVRFEFTAAAAPADARVLALGLDTACQLNAAVLPAVRAGKNQMTVSFEPGAEVFEENIQYDPKVDPAKRAFEIKNLVLKERSYSELGAKEKGQTGHIVYELAAPAGRRVAWVRVGGAFRSDGDVPADETYRIWYALNEPKGWKLLWEGDPAPYLSHWCFETNQEIPLRKAAQRVFVKYEMGRSARKDAEGGKMVAARLVWGCDPARGGTPRGGVKVTHLWRQDGKESSLSRVVKKSGASYAFDVPESKIENVSISMELEGRGPEGEVPHPLMTAPPAVERRALDDNDNVKAMREALARLDKDPSAETAADIMWNCKNKMTAGVMPPALMAIGGDRAREELKKAVGKVDGAQGCLMELLSFEGPAADLAVFLQDKKAGIRADAARLLARKGDKAAVEPLRAALAAEKEPEALAAEGAALLRLQEFPFEKPFLFSGRDDRSFDVMFLDAAWGPKRSSDIDRCDASGKVEIASAMAAAGMETGFKILAQALASPEKKVRYEAALALGESGRHEAERDLLTALADKSRWVRLAATAGLAGLGGKGSLKPLKSAADDDADEAVKSEARWALGEVKKRLAAAKKK